MLGMILGFLGGPLLSNLAAAYKAKLESAGAQDKLAVDLAVKEIEAEVAARAEATKVMVLENGLWFTWMPRAIVQWSFALFVGKCVVWDNMLGLGTTDPLQGDIATWSGWVMITWFSGRSLEKIAQVFGRK
jgi:hypothetical protein